MPLANHRVGTRLLGVVAFALALLLVVAAAAADHLNVLRLRDSFDWVAHTRQVLVQINSIEADLASAIATQRGYLLTGDKDQLASFRRFSAGLGAQMNDLRDLTSDNLDQRRRLDALIPLIEKRLALAAQDVEQAVVPEADPTSADPRQEEVRTRAAIREDLRRFRDIEAELLTVRQTVADRNATVSTWFAAATILLALAAAVVGVVLLRKEREYLLVERERSRALELQAELLHVARLNTVGQTASMLTHEVNQPLTAARNFLGAAQRMLGTGTAEPARVADAVARGSQQIERASEIIRHLRRFISRTEGTRTAEPVAELIGQAIAVSALERSDSRISQRIDVDLPAASIDRVQIQQVLVNLMRNALEAMADSERKELTISARSPDRSMIEITVQDTGPGLPEEVAAKLFQPFVTTKADGMGVGLSICRMIIEDHGGRIWFESDAGSGTAFHFTVPTVAKSRAERTGDRAGDRGGQSGAVAGSASG